MPRLDPDRLAELFGAHAPAMVLFVRGWLDRASAEEVVQDAFVRLMQQSRAPADARAWLYAVARRLAFDRLRRIRVRRRDDSPLLARSRAARAHDGGLDPEHVARLIDSLPPDEREAVVLRIWGGLTLEQASRVMDAPMTTIHRLFHAALARLSHHLEQPCPTRTPHR